MKNIRTILGAIIALIMIAGWGQKSNKQKEVNLNEREIVLLKKDSIILMNSASETVKKDSIKEAKKLPSDVKILTLVSPTFYFGDLPHVTFKDYSTQVEKEYEWVDGIPALNEIADKCDGNEGCPALKGQLYHATLKYKLMDIVDWNGTKLVPTGKKEKRWVFIALEKINKP